MGDPKKQKKKFSKPLHPWNKERIVAEKEIVKQYGLRRKYEIWKTESILRNFLSQAKKIIGSRTLQSEKDKTNLLNKACRLGLLKKDSRIEDILNLTLKDIMERRLQTLVLRKGFSSTMLQSRQLICHGHISISEKKLTSPSYIVRVDEESNIKLLVDPSKIIKKKESQESKKSDKSVKQNKESKSKEESKSKIKENPASGAAKAAENTPKNSGELKEK